MKVYVSVCHDRHMDDDIKVWKNPDFAIEYAKNFMSQYDNINEYNVSDWLYNATDEGAESGSYVFETKLLIDMIIF